MCCYSGAFGNPPAVNPPLLHREIFCRKKILKLLQQLSPLPPILKEKMEIAKSRFSWCLSCSKSWRRMVVEMSIIEMESQPQFAAGCLTQGLNRALHSSPAVLLPPV